jgi:enoyl-CoA hydratase
VAASAKLIKAAKGRTEDEFWELQGPEQARVFTSADAKEGPKAFAEKRAPNWTGA